MEAQTLLREYDPQLEKAGLEQEGELSYARCWIDLNEVDHIHEPPQEEYLVVQFRSGQEISIKKTDQVLSEIKKHFASHGS